eukprot:14515224-Ditylum_brightwellii.AAC.1
MLGVCEEASPKLCRRQQRDEVDPVESAQSLPELSQLLRPPLSSLMFFVALPIAKRGGFGLARLDWHIVMMTLTNYYVPVDV